MTREEPERDGTSMEFVMWGLGAGDCVHPHVWARCGPRIGALPTPPALSHSPLHPCCARVHVAHVGSLQFTEEHGPGVPLVVYSTMLTRGVSPTAGCLSDMDVDLGSTAMIGKHNYATQVGCGCVCECCCSCECDCVTV